MKKIAVFLIALASFKSATYAQSGDGVQPGTLAVQFFLNDFKSAQTVRSNNLGTVLKNREFGKIKEMSPGIAISYIKGVSKRYDVSGTLAGSFVDYPMNNKPAFGQDYLLLEADASLRAKLISNKAFINPYLQAGFGISKYQGYFGAFIPAGAGMQINLFDEAYLQINAQYRIPVSETTNYHFFFGIGLAGKIGK